MVNFHKKNETFSEQWPGKPGSESAYFIGHRIVYFFKLLDNGFRKCFVVTIRYQFPGDTVVYGIGDASDWKCDRWQSMCSCLDSHYAKTLVAIITFMDVKDQGISAKISSGQFRVVLGKLSNKKTRFSNLFAAKIASI
jgi:hypothetical protein